MQFRQLQRREFITLLGGAPVGHLRGARSTRVRFGELLRRVGGKMRSCLRVAIGLGAYSTLAAAEPPITIERLLDQGWDLAGYVGTSDNRSSLMLFRHKDKKYLVQCSVLYDVTRAPRPMINCYELH